MQKAWEERPCDQKVELDVEGKRRADHEEVFFQVPDGMSTSQARRWIEAQNIELKKEDPMRWQLVKELTYFVKSKAESFKDNIDLIRCSKKTDFTEFDEMTKKEQREGCLKNEGAAKITKHREMKNNLEPEEAKQDILRETKSWRRHFEWKG